MSGLNMDVRYIKGIGEKRALILQKLGIFTLFDLISHFPRDYEDRTSIKTIAELNIDETACVAATAASDTRGARIRKSLEICKLRAFDDTGVINITFFNQRYIKDAIVTGETYVFYGKVGRGPGGTKELLNPVFERLDGSGAQTGRLVPIYRLSAGLSGRVLSSYIRRGLELAENMPEFLPDAVRMKHQLAHIRFAYENIHFPESRETLELARRRLIFEELLVLSLGLSMLKSRRAGHTGLRFENTGMDDYLDSLPYKLTGAQMRSISDAVSDMTSSRPMNRIIQGDVGSGKTAVAAACCFLAYKNGYQSAFMAPTEILAEQHYESLSAPLSSFGMTVGLMTGGRTAAERRRVAEGLKSGEIDLAIGTHALISEGVSFLRLGLAVTDEQHRFGVSQRAALSSKGESPHMLVMSATPIPRTLALVMYGDLDVSVIDELPPGRQKIDTFAVGEDMRPRIVTFTKKLLTQGRQVYVVCPVVDSDDPEDGRKAALAYSNHLAAKVFPEFKVAHVHGRMKSTEKDAVMRAFAAHETDILVATTVIEVGINVPNAALIIIENADRFGLSQLHQLRGRVGRGEHKSYCIMFSSSVGEDAKARLQAMCETNDGFKISEEDLKIRGPGDFFGSRQHGMPDFKIADLSYDIRTLKEAQEAARDILADDPKLKSPENSELMTRINTLFKGGASFN